MSVMVVMTANAGVFLVFASRTFGEVRIEFLTNGFGAGRAFDLENDWHGVTFGEALSGYERVAFGNECYHSRV